MSKKLSERQVQKALGLYSKKYEVTVRSMGVVVGRVKVTATSHKHAIEEVRKRFDIGTPTRHFTLKARLIREES